MSLTLQIMIGIWRAVLQLPDAELPFNFEMKKEQEKYVMVIMNGEERIRVDSIVLNGDSLIIRLPVFDSEFRVITKGDKMAGTWINYSRKGNPAIPFRADHGIKERFISEKNKYINVEGRWETWFDAGTPDSSLAIGVFSQEADKVNGTYLTASGDHRFLEGITTGNEMWLSTFDGSHCWLYHAVVNGQTMEGTYWSGNHYKSKWHGERNSKIELKDPYAVTTVTKQLNFSFPDADSNIVSLSDERFKNKVVIIQIMGSWCPNCLDETAFLSSYYNENKNSGIEMIGLAFEKTADFSRASGNVKRLQKRFNVLYPLLIAGVVGKEEVMKKLEGIKNFSSYPTTIFIDRKGNVSKVYSGFSGPATGIEYEKYKKEFDATIKDLLN